MSETNTAARSGRTLPAFLALSCVGAFAAGPAWAADPIDPAAVPDPDPTQDVIVNGELLHRDDPKQVAPLVDTPKSIVVLPKDVIRQTGSTTLEEALRTVPGITFGAAEGGNPIGDRPFIRGFDSQGSIFVDGVRDLASQTRETFDIDQVQIVRGSDSTLGGRGSPGGTIDIISKLPENRTFGELDASGGNAGYKRVTADLNWRLTDTVAVRLDGVWHDQDVAGRDAIWQRRWGIAPSLTVGLGTSTRLTASYYHLTSHELPDSGIPYLYVCSATVCNAPAGNTHTAPALGNVTLLGGQTGDVERSTFYGLTDRDFRDTQTDEAMLRVEHDFGKLTLRNTARFTHDTQDYIYTQPDDSQGDVFGIPTIRGGTVDKVDGGTELTGGGYVWRRANTRYSTDQSLTDQLDLYGTFHTGRVEHSIAMGAEFDWEKDRRGTYVLASGSTISPRCDTFTVGRYYCTSLFDPHPNDPWVNYASDMSTTPAPIVKGAPNTETQNEAVTAAVYAFDSITLAPWLIANLGARFDHFGSSITPPFAAGATAFRLTRDDNLFNWQAGLVAKPTHDTSVYASYATAATPPNTLLGEGREDNALPTTNTAANLALLDALKVQKTKSYEVGAKGALFHDRLNLSAALFQTDIDNARVTDENNNVAYIGRTRIKGAELSVAGQILPGWTVFGGYTYLDPRIVDGGFTALTVAANGAAKATTIDVPSVNTGKQVPQTARNNFTLTSDVVIAKRFHLGGTAIYMDRQYGGYADNRTATQTSAGVVTVNPATVVLYRYIPDYWRFDANASVDLNRHLRLSVNAQNLTDKAYFTQAYASHYATIAPGRTVFGTLGVRF